MNLGASGDSHKLAACRRRNSGLVVEKHCAGANLRINSVESAMISKLDLEQRAIA
jgi:hypothetical protein